MYYCSCSNSDISYDLIFLNKEKKKKEKSVSMYYFRVLRYNCSLSNLHPNEMQSSEKCKNKLSPHTLMPTLHVLDLLASATTTPPPKEKLRVPCASVSQKHKKRWQEPLLLDLMLYHAPCQASLNPFDRPS